MSTNFLWKVSKNSKNHALKNQSWSTILKKIWSFFDRACDYRLTSAYYAWEKGLAFFPAYKFFLSFKSFGLKNYQNTFAGHKSSVQKYYCRRDDPIERFLKVIDAKDIEDINYHSIKSNENKCNEILQKAPYQHTLWLYEYLRIHGDLRVADYIRCLSLQAVLTEQKKTNRLLPRSLHASLELKQYENILRILHEKKLNHIRKNTVQKFKAFALCCLGDQVNAKKTMNAFYNKNDLDFGNIIKDRSIAIVGPAIPEDHIASEIDSYDLVVRTNYNPEKRLPSEIYGTRCDISYCNIDYVINQSLIGYNSLKYILYKSYNSKKTYDGYRKSHNFMAPSRINYNPGDLFWSGFSNAVPMAIYDLLHFSPHKIKIFCVNFFTSKKRVHGNYQSAKTPNDFVMINLKRHDLVSNFMFCKNLYQLNILNADRLSTEILKMDRIEYSGVINTIVNNKKS